MSREPTIGAMARQTISFRQGATLALLYFLPALLACAVLLLDYRSRVLSVADHIDGVRRQVTERLKLPGGIALKPPHGAGQGSEHELIRFYRKLAHEASTSPPAGMDLQSRAGIRAVLKSIWRGNALIVLMMTMLPFLLFAARFGWSRRLPLNYRQRRGRVNHSWWMKFLVALVMVYGWIYVMNPHGRGADTIEKFLIVVDLSRPDTLPLFLHNDALSPVIAGFLGWYLYLLTYFFAKMAVNDVVSTRVYGFMLQKLLFTYGIALVLPSFDVASQHVSANLVAFLIGYFPLSAFSLLKDAGASFLQRVQEEQGALSELPGISRWQILRLEEEGIDSIAALAYCREEHLRHNLPALSRLIDYWVDIARLYTIVGTARYNRLKPYCITASGFLARSEEADFVTTVAEAEVGDAREIAGLIHRTFVDHERRGRRRSGPLD